MFNDFVIREPACNVIYHVIIVSDHVYTAHCVVTLPTLNYEQLVLIRTLYTAL